jgi:hypothetical protein
MNQWGISSIVFVCIFGSAMLGFYLRTVLHDHHLSEDSINSNDAGRSHATTCKPPKNE